MLLVRRLYVYFISLVSLVMLAVGLVNLLELVFIQVRVALGSQSLRGADFVERQVSLFLALIVVALPVWLIHWWLAERSILRGGEQAETERRAASRALYLAIVLLASFGAWLLSLHDFVGRQLADLFGAPRPSFDPDDIQRNLAVLLVAGAIWAYHAAVRRRDIRAGPLEDASTWIPRLYLYAAAFAGVMVLLFGAAGLVRLTLAAVIQPPSIVATADWWRRPLADATASVLVGFLAWALHWGHSLRLYQHTTWVGASERRSVLRRLYLYLVVVVGVFVTLRGVSESLETLLRAALQVEQNPGETPFLERLLQPVLAATPFLLFWFYHRRQVFAEARQHPEVAGQASVRRLYTYLVALVGLAFAGFGLAYILGLLLDLLMGTETLGAPEDFWRRRIAQFVALIIVGAGVWLRHWFVAQRSLVADPDAEQNATTRRVYLYIIMAVSLVAVLTSLAIVIYQALLVLLNVEPASGLISAVSRAAGVVTVAGAILAYHVSILRQDIAARPAAAPGEATLALVMTGPPGADLGATMTGLQAHLPEGYSLRPAGANPHSAEPDPRGASATDASRLAGTAGQEPEAPLTGADADVAPSEAPEGQEEEERRRGEQPGGREPGETVE